MLYIYGLASDCSISYQCISKGDLQSYPIWNYPMHEVGKPIDIQVLHSKMDWSKNRQNNSTLAKELRLLHSPTDMSALFSKALACKYTDTVPDYLQIIFIVFIHTQDYLYDLYSHAQNTHTCTVCKSLQKHCARQKVPLQCKIINI